MRPVYDDDDLLDVPPGYISGPSKADLVDSAAKFAAEILEDPQYLEKLKARAFAGALPPAIEQMLWAYRFGKPMEMSKIKQGPSDSQLLADMSLEDLTALARKNAEDASLLLEAKMHKMGIAPIRGHLQ
jgi:hypothetical protein